MKTLGAWIAGIFALGLMLGSFVSGSGAVAESDVDAALEAAPRLDQVDCGEGREALLEADGATSFKVRCVALEPPEPPARAASALSTRSTESAPVTAAAPVATKAPVTPAPEQPAPDANADVDDGESNNRTWKESAVVIGGAAGAGAGIGALAKGKKGAAVGAAIGAATGAAYELIKKDKAN